MGTTWQPTSEDAKTFEGRDAATGEVKWTGSRADLVFGSNSELRALAEVYASDDAKEKFVRRLRRRVGQGDEPRPVRPRLIMTSRPARAAGLDVLGPQAGCPATGEVHAQLVGPTSGQQGLHEPAASKVAARSTTPRNCHRTAGTGSSPGPGLAGPGLGAIPSGDVRADQVADAVGDRRGDRARDDLAQAGADHAAPVQRADARTDAE